MFIVPFVITFVTLAARSAATPAVPFELSQDGGIVVPVSIDGQGPFRFLLDTGASHSAVSSALVLRLGLEATAKTLVTTSVGETWRPVVRVRRLALGSAAATDVFPSVVGPDVLHDQLRVHGVLGQDVLAGLHYTLDYGRRELSWGGPPTADRARTRVAVEWIAGCPVVRTATTDAAAPLRLIPDSGATHVVLFDGGTLPAYEPFDGFMRLDTLEQRRSVRSVRVSELRIGTFVLRRQPAALVDARGGQADGLLPLHLFRRVTINGPAGYVLFDPW